MFQSLDFPPCQSQLRSQFRLVEDLVLFQNIMKIDAEQLLSHRLVQMVAHTFPHAQSAPFRALSVRQKRRKKTGMKQSIIKKNPVLQEHQVSSTHSDLVRVIRHHFANDGSPFDSICFQVGDQ